MATVFKSVTGGYVIKSANIKVYPCTNRASGIDTNAQLSTEHNITNSRGGKTYVIDKPSSGTVKLSVGGYYFELLNLDASDVTNYLADSKYCNIKVADNVLKDTVGNNNTLDYNSGSGDNYFYGLLFTTAAKTDTGWISLKFDQTKEVVLIYSDVGAAAANHTHSYAGSSSAGGAANSVKAVLTFGNKTYNGSETKAITLADIGAAASSHNHAVATTSTAGFMSAEDKEKLNGIAPGAVYVKGNYRSGESGYASSIVIKDASGTEKTYDIPAAAGQAVSSISATSGSHLTAVTSGTTATVGIENGYVIPSAAVVSGSPGSMTTTLCTANDRYLISDTALKVNNSSTGLAAIYTIANNAKNTTRTINYASDLNLMGAVNTSGSTYSNGCISMNKGTLSLKTDDTATTNITLNGHTGGISCKGINCESINAGSGDICTSGDFYTSAGCITAGDIDNEYVELNGDNGQITATGTIRGSNIKPLWSVWIIKNTGSASRSSEPGFMLTTILAADEEINTRQKLLSALKTTTTLATGFYKDTNSASSTTYGVWCIRRAMNSNSSTVQIGVQPYSGAALSITTKELDLTDATISATLLDL